MGILTNIEPQPIVDELCAEFQRLDSHLGSPRYGGLPFHHTRYWIENNGKKQWLVTKYFRNLAALDKFEAFIERLDPLWISIEYFNGRVSLDRTVGEPFAQAGRDRLFISVAIDSLRSSLDIFAKFLGCYFGLSNKEEVGFTYKGLIVPLREQSQSLSDALNHLYGSKEYNLLKEFRDAEKHEGLDKHQISISESRQKMTIDIKQPDPVNMQALQDASAILLTKLRELVRHTVDELHHWELGYNCPDDKVFEETTDGFFTMPETAVDLPGA